MSDTDPAKMTDAQLDTATAELMGWHRHRHYNDTAFWVDEQNKFQALHTDCGRDAWSPTTNAEHSAELLDYMWKSGRFCAILVGVTHDANGDDWSSVYLYEPSKFRIPTVGHKLPYTEDPHGRRCLCGAAVKAHRAEQEAR